MRRTFKENASVELEDVA